MIELLGYNFIQHAIYAGILVSIAVGIVLETYISSSVQEVFAHNFLRS